MAGDAAQAAAQAADHAGGDGRIEAEGAADCDDKLADADLAGIAERRVRQADAVGLDNRQIGPWIGADDTAFQLAAVGQAHAHRLLAVHDVMIGKQEAVGSEEYSGAGAFATAGAQVDHGRSKRFGDLDDDARIGVEGLLLAGQGRGRRRGGIGAGNVIDPLLPVRHVGLPVNRAASSIVICPCDSL
jgi:hypothetical protein